MRMWMTDPRIMCRRHLLGEHVELHMLVGSLQRNKSVSGFIEKDLIEPQNIRKRHADLVAEMQRRGYKHNSPLPSVSVKIRHHINLAASKRELVKRCLACRCRDEALRRLNSKAKPNK